MALLETMNEIQQRRDRVMSRRERRAAMGEPVAGIPVPKERLRAAMSYLDTLYKENRMDAMRQREQQNKVSQAMQMLDQQEAQQQPAQQPQAQQAPQATQMAAQPLMGQVGMAPQQQQQMPAQGLLGMPRQQ